ncbi:universal stress protein [Mycobacterium sp.]|uniref:universal stress protein n=1 Tax=Mycobacterium sp. TaxID=1785 RepID=UPI003C764A51
MVFDRYPPKSVVVGVDGSQAAIRAARWAVDEVVCTDIPLRLLYVTEAIPSAGPSTARAARAAAEEVVHDAYRAVEEMGRPLKVEMEIIHGRPVPALIAASRSTTLLCVGDTGAAQHPDAWLGSTAKDLAQSGHCSVAIVRGDNRDTGSVGGGSIVAFVDESPDGIDVLELAIQEARHRGAPLSVLTAAQGDLHMKRCIDNYPEIEIDNALLEGSLVDYLAEHSASIQLAVVGAAQTGELQQLFGPAGGRALRNTDFSLLVVGLERPGR